MSIYLSGIQPTGKFHIGNYFGCLQPFVSLSSITPSSTKNIFLVADMHCHTKTENNNNIHQNVFEAVRSLLAAGIDPESTHIVQQSKILEHANLSWYLSCLANYSRAENMTQFKSNSMKHPNVGLLMYPILQAADILIYDPDYVIVGPDQEQHLELASELSARANRLSKSTIFKTPRPLLNTNRIKSFKNGEFKMSKSDPDGCLFMTDEPSSILKKVMRAKTDSIFGINYDPYQRKALSNLIDIFCLLKRRDVCTVIEEFKNAGHQHFKEQLSTEISKYFCYFRDKYQLITNDYIQEVLAKGNQAASKLASKKLSSYLSSINK